LHIDYSNVITGFFQDSDFIFVLQAGFGSGSGFLPLGSGLESDSKKLESETEVGPDPDYRSRLWQDFTLFSRTRTRSQKFVKKRTRARSHFSSSAVAGVCAVIS